MEANKPTNRSDTRLIVFSGSSSMVIISVCFKADSSFTELLKGFSVLLVVGCFESNYSVPYDHVIFRSSPNPIMHAYSGSRSDEIVNES